jgi:hypothetical protein
MCEFLEKRLKSAEAHFGNLSIIPAVELPDFSHFKNIRFSEYRKKGPANESNQPQQISREERGF